jgi:putative DNA primase/helicase
VLLDRGLQVFPCDSKKAPLTAHGVKDATDDRARIAEWNREHGGPLWGAAMTADIGAIDIDVKGGRPGFETLSKLLADRGELPPTLTNRTPTGGEHRLFFFGRALKNAVDLTNDKGGLDVRSEGGYIIVPPSAVPGGAYQWNDARQKIAQAPEWFVEDIVRLAGVPRRARSRGPISEGTRN